jgi:hypothetical protein
MNKRLAIEVRQFVKAILRLGVKLGKGYRVRVGVG